MNKLGNVKPGASSEIIEKNIKDSSVNFTKSDCVVMMCGSNDVARNESHKALKKIRSALSSLTSTNTVVISIPPRYDLPDFSIVNKEISVANKKLKQLCNHFQNARLIDISDFQRAYFTRHGMHLNGVGKDHLAQLITEEIHSLIKPKVTIPLPALGINVQGN